MKGQEWYQATDVAQEYDDKRFSRGGRLIDRREKEAVLDAIGPVDGKDVLEIACGTGRFTAMLAERGADVVGLDISAEMLAEARQKAKASGVGDAVEFLRGDAGRLPFEDDEFDAVIAMRFFHLADTPAAYLDELQRVSRDQVMFDTFKRYSTRSIYNWALPMGSRLYSRSEVESLIDGAGLELVEDSHDFVLPYGFYRKIPDSIASTLRSIDTTLGVGPGGDAIASVSYWSASVE
ncbi:Ubiquinone/menaquinone biosynthesis C-methylase UbiE [Natronoarchaeum philippinense]|uniref:Ubiquinone/menaquinone biosynthesis C-methylase UbiE n=1 Tax=Natronoarchaeum philippinense TaxID=558529 RepID=A0A285NV44_NATPI|nr:class I SAM-dependent methyltransferase [Natronoarchaeum philippinense]SNZ13108.1 Ubiquinone/menaquinone biosynthesis C-methylase UbiE [Natronoarchaeum philippinense]